MIFLGSGMLELTEHYWQLSLVEQVPYRQIPDYVELNIIGDLCIEPQLDRFINKRSPSPEGYLTVSLLKMTKTITIQFTRGGVGVMIIANQRSRMKSYQVGAIVSADSYARTHARLIQQSHERSRQSIHPYSTRSA